MAGAPLDLHATHIADIPDEILQLLALLLPTQAIGRLCQVSRRFNVILHDPEYVKSLCIRHGILVDSVAEASALFRAHYCVELGYFSYDTCVSLTGDNWHPLDVGRLTPRNRACQVTIDGVERAVLMTTSGVLFMFDQSLRQFTQPLPALPSKHARSGCALTVHCNVLYAIGCNASKSSVYSLRVSAEHPEWELETELRGAYERPSVGVIGGKLYISEHRFAECYDIVTGVIQNCSRSEVHSAGYCVYQGKLYVAGGLWRSTELLNSLQCYDPEADQWTRLADMQCYRQSLSLVEYRGRLWAVGGFNGQQGTHFVESYDVQSNTWRSECSMPSAGHAGGAVVIQCQYRSC
eukprot:TRINITY_DN11958_c0_g1_i1.p1 TRINITY_DN11958_c0_g1~~TRINITY_DN11958_c0_g1_i1.p1  ORF type:complete len:364 (-),score=32.99 TRINITY_DN11958_c0_g1_i1:63-1112(-)